MVFGCGLLPPDLGCFCPWSLNLDHYKEILFKKNLALKQREREEQSKSLNSLIVIPDFSLKASSLRTLKPLKTSGPGLEEDFLVVCISAGGGVG